MPPEETPASSEDRVNHSLLNMLGPDADDDTPIVIEDAPAPEPEPEPEPETPPEPEPEPEENEDEEIDFDKDPTPEPEEPLTESKAVERAKIEGRRAKELEARLQERDIEFERVQKELDTQRAKLEEIEATRINPEDHPEFKSLKQEVLDDVAQAAELLPGDASRIVKDFGFLMGSYLNLPAPSTERVEKLAALKGDIVDRLGISEVPYAELDADERKSYEKEALDVLKLIQRNAGKTKQIQELHATLSEKAKIGHLSIGVKAYESTAKEFGDALSVVGDLSEDVIETDPFSIAAIVSKMVRDNPEYAKRLAVAKKEALDFVAGPKVYTQAEIDKLQAQGIDIKVHNAERARIHKEKQKREAVTLVEAKMIRADYIKLKREVAALKADKDSEESETDALLSTHKRKPGKVVVEKYVPAKDRPLSIEKYLG